MSLGIYLINLIAGSHQGLRNRLGGFYRFCSLKKKVLPSRFQSRGIDPAGS